MTTELSPVHYRVKRAKCSQRVQKRVFRVHRLCTAGQLPVLSVVFQRGIPRDSSQCPPIVRPQIGSLTVAQELHFSTLIVCVWTIKIETKTTYKLAASTREGERRKSDGHVLVSVHYPAIHFAPIWRPAIVFHSGMQLCDSVQR